MHAYTGLTKQEEEAKEFFKSHALHLPQECRCHRCSESPSSPLLRALHLAGEPPAATVSPHFGVMQQCGDGHRNHQGAGAGALGILVPCLPSSFPMPALWGSGDTSAPGSSEHLLLPPHWGHGSSSEAHPLLPAPVNCSPRRTIPGLRTRKDGDLPGAPFLTPLCPLIHLNFPTLLKHN